METVIAMDINIFLCHLICPFFFRPNNEKDSFYSKSHLLDNSKGNRRSSQWLYSHQCRLQERNPSRICNWLVPTELSILLLLKKVMIALKVVINENKFYVPTENNVKVFDAILSQMI